MMNAKLSHAFAAVLLALGSMAAHAAPMAIDFTVAGGPVTGSGTVFTDSSNLDPNDVTTNLADLTALTLSLSGIPSVPTTTSFTKPDLLFWALFIDGAGAIADLNFFMDVGDTNADGYSISGFEPFGFSLCQGGPGCASPLDLILTVTDVHAAVPEPATLALLGLGLAGLGFSRRRQ